jgi:hypothetical protein
VLIDIRNCDVDLEKNSKGHYNHGRDVWLRYRLCLLLTSHHENSKISGHFVSRPGRRTKSPNPGTVGSYGSEIRFELRKHSLLFWHCTEIFLIIAKHLPSLSWNDKYLERLGWDNEPCMQWMCLCMALCSSCCICVATLERRVGCSIIALSSAPIKRNTISQQDINVVSWTAVVLSVA